MKLIDNWRKAWRFTSVQSALILALVNGLFSVFPVMFQSLNPTIYCSLMVLGNISVVVLRLIAQPKLENNIKS